MKNRFASGFKAVAKHLKDNPRKMRAVRSCLNCGHNGGDTEVDCHNTYVSEFDMVSTEEGVEFCCYWEMSAFE